MVSREHEFPCNGQVTKWQYQGKKPNGFRAIIWRPVDGFPMKFRIVGINNIPAGEVNIPITYTVPKYQRITVEAGDVIGWSFRSSVLTYNDGGGYDVCEIIGKNLHGSLQVNDEHECYSALKREFSIAAIVDENSSPGE